MEAMVKFCFHMDCNPLNPTEVVSAEFLSKEFIHFNTASSVNHAISAISSVTEMFQGHPLVVSPVIKALRRSVNMQKPPGPAYDSTWDIGPHIQSLGSNKTMSLENLRLKTI